MYLYIGNPPNTTWYGLKRKNKLHQYIPPPPIYLINLTSTVTDSTYIYIYIYILYKKPAHINLLPIMLLAE